MSSSLLFYLVIDFSVVIGEVKERRGDREKVPLSLLFCRVLLTEDLW